MLTLQAQRSDFENIDLWRAEYIADQHKGEDLYNIPALVHGLTSQLTTDVERFRAIYFWICHNVRSEYNLMFENDRQWSKLKNDPEAIAVWNQAFNKEVFKRLRNDKKTLCTGYAYLVKEMANLADLECEIVYGFGPTNSPKSTSTNPTHSWNVIKLDGKWYVCDATWSSGYIDMSTFLFIPEYDNSYFLMDPLKFAESHKPLEQKWTLLDQ